MNKSLHPDFLGRVISAAIDVWEFSKTHEYPKEMSPEFFEQVQLLDKLETALHQGGFITLPLKKEQP